MTPPLVCQFCRRKPWDNRQWYGIGNAARYCSLECVRCHIVAVLLPSPYSMTGISRTLERLDTHVGSMPLLAYKLPAERKP